MADQNVTGPWKGDRLFRWLLAIASWATVAYYLHRFISTGERDARNAVALIAPMALGNSLDLTSFWRRAPVKVHLIVGLVVLLLAFLAWQS